VAGNGGSKDLAAAVYTGVKMAGLARRDAEVEPST